MRCERYQKILTDAVAAGTEPPREVRAHLSVCASCSAFFADEQALFAAIDAGTRSAANAATPPSLLPIFHVRLTQEASQNGVRTSHAKWLYLGAATATAVLVLAFFSVLQKPNVFVGNTHWEAATIGEGSTSSPNVNPQQRGFTTKVAGPTRSLGAVRLGVREKIASTGLGRMEVLVPPDQELLLARYVQTMRRHAVGVVSAE
jgi:hypothetical protein